MCVSPKTLQFSLNLLFFEYLAKIKKIERGVDPPNVLEDMFNVSASVYVLPKDCKISSTALTWHTNLNVKYETAILYTQKINEFHH